MAQRYELEDEDQALVGQCLDWLSMMAETQIDDASRDGMIAVIKLVALRTGIPFEIVEETQLEDGSFHVEVKTVTDELGDEDDSGEEDPTTVH